jgi:hypothetical protein
MALDLLIVSWNSPSGVESFTQPPYRPRVVFLAPWDRSWSNNGFRWKIIPWGEFGDEPLGANLWRSDNGLPEVKENGSVELYENIPRGF